MPHQTKQKPKLVSYNSDIFQIAKSRILSQNNGSSVLIPHVCNNVNSFGAGFASAVANEFPIVKENFHMLGNKAKLGYVQYITVSKDKTYSHELIIANMIAQNGVVNKNNIRPLNYEYLMKCMIDVKNHISNFLSKNESSIEIHCPKFGSGLAGGNWNFITNLIEDIWMHVPVFIYSPHQKHA